MQASWGGYWYATPEQGVQNYRELLAGGYFPQVRRFLLQPDFTEQTGVDVLNHGSRTTGHGLKAEPLSYLAGWTWETRRRATSVWHGFIDELCGSTNRSVRLEGLYLRCAQAITDEAHDRAFAQLLEALQSAPVTEVDATLISDIDMLLATKPREGFSQAAQDSRKQAWTQLKQKLLDAKVSLAREAEIRQRLDYLAAGDYDFHKFAPLFSSFDCSSNEAQILLPALAAYRTNLTALAGKLRQESEALRPTGRPSPRYLELSTRIGGLGSSKYWLDQLEQTLRYRLTNSGPRILLMASVTNQPSAGPPASPVSGVGSAGPRPPGYAAPFSPLLELVRRAVQMVVRQRRCMDREDRRADPRMARRVLVFVAVLSPAEFLAARSREPIRRAWCLSNVLEVNRYWPFPDSVPGISQRVRLDLDNCFFREGRLWAEHATLISAGRPEERHFSIVEWCWPWISIRFNAKRLPWTRHPPPCQIASCRGSSGGSKCRTAACT